MGDGRRVSMLTAEIKDDILLGSKDAAERGKIPELTAEEMETLFDIFADPNRIVSVAPGEEVVVTDDGCTMIFYGNQENSGQGLPLSRVNSVLTYERVCAADTASIGHTDYSCKPVKPIISKELNDYFTASQVTTIPLFYGTQPNMGL
jgi:dimethylamine--corrinoid protein Co-methyltransferase